MADEPKFLSVNRVDADALFTSTNGASAATLPRLIDRDRELLWRTVGANNQAVAVDLVAEFRVGGISIKRSIDTIALLNHNAKKLGFARWDDGASDFVTVGVVDNLTSRDIVFSFAAVSTRKVKVTFFGATQGADPSLEKEAGELLAMGTLFAFGTDRGLSALRIEHLPVADVEEMADRGLVVQQLRWAGNRVDRFRARVGFELLDKADYDALRAVVKNGRFTAYLEPVQRPEEFFEVTAAASPWAATYTSPGYKAPGYSLDLELREV